MPVRGHKIDTSDSESQNDGCTRGRKVRRIDGSDDEMAVSPSEQRARGGRDSPGSRGMRRREDAESGGEDSDASASDATDWLVGKKRKKTERPMKRHISAMPGVGKIIPDYNSNNRVRQNMKEDERIRRELADFVAPDDFFSEAEESADEKSARDDSTDAGSSSLDDIEESSLPSQTTRRRTFLSPKSRRSRKLKARKASPGTDDSTSGGVPTSSSHRRTEMRLLPDSDSDSDNSADGRFGKGKARREPRSKSVTIDDSDEDGLESPGKLLQKRVATVSKPDAPKETSQDRTRGDGGTFQGDRARAGATLTDKAGDKRDPGTARTARTASDAARKSSGRKDSVVVVEIDLDSPPRVAKRADPPTHHPHPNPITHRRVDRLGLVSTPKRRKRQRSSDVYVSDRSRSGEGEREYAYASSSTRKSTHTHTTTTTSNRTTKRHRNATDPADLFSDFVPVHDDDAGHGAPAPSPRPRHHNSPPGTTSTPTPSLAPPPPPPSPPPSPASASASDAAFDLFSVSGAPLHVGTVPYAHPGPRLRLRDEHPGRARPHAGAVAVADLPAHAHSHAHSPRATGPPTPRLGSSTRKTQHQHHSESQSQWRSHGSTPGSPAPAPGAMDGSMATPRTPRMPGRKRKRKRNDADAGQTSTSVRRLGGRPAPATDERDVRHGTRAQVAGGEGARSADSGFGGSEDKENVAPVPMRHKSAAEAAGGQTADPEPASSISSAQSLDTPSRSTLAKTTMEETGNSTAIPSIPRPDPTSTAHPVSPTSSTVVKQPSHTASSGAARITTAGATDTPTPTPLFSCSCDGQLPLSLYKGPVLKCGACGDVHHAVCEGFQAIEAADVAAKWKCRRCCRSVGQKPLKPALKYEYEASFALFLLTLRANPGLEEIARTALEKVTLFTYRYPNHEFAGTLAHLAKGTKLEAEVARRVPAGETDILGRTVEEAP